jgi:GNAT superfamily N-acetyltransferase
VKLEALPSDLLESIYIEAYLAFAIRAVKSQAGIPLRQVGKAPDEDFFMSNCRRCRDDDRAAIFTIVNAAAEAYRGVIPADRWNEPYMPSEELDREIAAGVVFWGREEDGVLVGVMGIQPAGDVDLIRHAYVMPRNQRRGVGGKLLRHLQRLSTLRMLVGTWEAADWAIAFYKRHGFELVAAARKRMLLKTYWNIPDQQIEASAVLANPPFEEP